MYVIVFNRLGYLILFTSVLLGFLSGIPASQYVGEGYVTVIQSAVMASTILLWDLVYRFTHNKFAGWMRFVHPRMGGQVFFIPVWACIPVLGLVALINSYFRK